MKNLLLVSQYYDDYLYHSIKKHGYEITNCNIAELTSDTPKSTQHLGVLDLRDCNDFLLIKRLLVDIHFCMPVIIIVERQQLKNIEIKRLIGKYAWDYHTEPINYDIFFRLLGHAYGLSTLKRISLSSLKADDEAILVNSPVMQALDDQVRRIAPTDIPVLIRGDSGTGKELVANNIHQKSHRSSGPFIAVNCGSMVSGLDRKSVV